MAECDHVCLFSIDSYSDTTQGIVLRPSSSFSGLNKKQCGNDSKMPKWEILGLYRVLLRRGRKLVHTDKDFFQRTVREEFERWRGERDPAVIQFQIEVCKRLTLSTHRTQGVKVVCGCKG